MFNSVSKGVEEYKRELLKYVKWINTLKATHGPDFDPLGDLDTGDYNTIMSWNKTLQGMEKVLGLTAKEINRIGDECGVERKRAYA